jgi:hypothetical protein
MYFQKYGNESSMISKGLIQHDMEHRVDTQENRDIMFHSFGRENLSVTAPKMTEIQ